MRMLKGRVLVLRDKDEAEISGIAVPESYRRDHMKWCGRVVAAGPDTELNPGEVVWFERVRMEGIEQGGDELCMVDYKDCWGVED